jgi:membrane protein implicated in regulation of membrane protease activity
LARRGEYKNFIGCTAVVHSETLCIKTLGEIKWSGAVCKARLTKSRDGNNAKKGENVKIINVENNIFIVERL